MTRMNEYRLPKKESASRENGNNEKREDCAIGVRMCVHVRVRVSACVCVYLDAFVSVV